MKIDFSAKILGLNGKPLTRLERDEAGRDVETPWTLGQMAADAVLAPQAPSGGGASVQSVVERFALATQIYSGGQQDITPQQATMIQESVAAVYAPAVAGPVIMMTNGG